MSFAVTRFAAIDDPEALRRCQRLRYRVYHEELGLDPPDMDHTRRLDVQANDPVCDLLMVTRKDDGEIAGTVRIQGPGTGRYYAEDEFVLEGPWWHGRTLVEGARFAVSPAYRDGAVPLLLFQAFRARCHERGWTDLVSVVLLPDARQEPQIPLRALRWLSGRVRFELDRARPRPGYVYEPLAALSVEDLGDVTPAMPGALPPMLRLLATPRSTVCAPPAYCRKFGTWNLLLVTDLAPRGPLRSAP
jgi:hypothetical protein